MKSPTNSLYVRMCYHLVKWFLFEELNTVTAMVLGKKRFLAINLFLAYRVIRSSNAVSNLYEVRFIHDFVVGGI